MIIFAIDPGVSGGYAVIDTDLMLGEAESFRSVTAARIAVDQIKEQHMRVRGVDFVIEEVHASPIMSPSAAFTFGENFGSWIGCIRPSAILGVTPQSWQRQWATRLRRVEESVPAAIAKTARKRELRTIAEELFPSTKVTLSNCDALLIGYVAAHEFRANGRVTSGKLL